MLCYFEGLTLDEAARRLRCPAGTLRSRLARAREKLRIGLARRGVVLPAAALGAVLAPRSASASIPPLLCDSTTRAAIAFAARHAAAGGALSAPAAALAQEVLRSMLLHKLETRRDDRLAPRRRRHRRGLARPLAGDEGRAREGPGGPAAKVAPHGADRPDRDEARSRRPARMTVAGRVLDPDGKPVEGAVVDLIARPRSPWVGASERDRPLHPAGPGPVRRRRPVPARRAPHGVDPRLRGLSRWPPRPGSASAGPS